MCLATGELCENMCRYSQQGSKKNNGKTVLLYGKKKFKPKQWKKVHRLTQGMCLVENIMKNGKILGSLHLSSGSCYCLCWFIQ